MRSEPGALRTRPPISKVISTPDAAEISFCCIRRAPCGNALSLVAIAARLTRSSGYQGAKARSAVPVIAPERAPQGCGAQQMLPHTDRIPKLTPTMVTSDDNHEACHAVHASRAPEVGCLAAGTLIHNKL